MTSTQVVEASVTTNNSPSQYYTSLDNQPTTNTDSPGSQPTTVLLRTTVLTNLDNQPTTNTGSPGSQPTTVLLRTTPTLTINQLQTLTHLGSELSLYILLLFVYKVKTIYSVEILLYKIIKKQNISCRYVLINPVLHVKHTKMIKTDLKYP